jgi:GrpB-like predicted nucleotidyltransferase (UPF0157 family)
MELIGGIEKREIILSEYDPAWPEKFEAHRRIITEALGATARSGRISAAGA